MGSESTNGKTRRNDLIYPELSYQIIGCIFEVHNDLGGGYHEKYYQRALDRLFTEKGLGHKQQVCIPVSYKEQTIGKHFLDFLVENKIVVEIKKGNRYSKKHIDQVLNYLKSSNLKLAILVNFGNDAVSFKRIVNFNS